MRKGKSYASKAEARYADKLDIAQKSGELLFYLRQVPFELPGSTTYRADFLEFWIDGTVCVTDVKGFETPEFKIKKALLEETYPVSLKIVKKV